MWFYKKDDYRAAIDATASIVRNGRARALAKRRGLDVLDLTWEDTARFEGSSVGPNISDMTIMVEHAQRRSCMPVIRYPNFGDRTADVRLDRFGVLVGNEAKSPLRSVSLAEYLGDLRRFLSRPDSWSGARRSLLADDTHALVSAQACFLPVPTSGRATFNPVLFNYQSAAGAPAVLAVVATREGTSATIIDNTRDGFSSGATWGQRLFFNAGGERASFTAERASTFAGDELDGPVTSGTAHGLNAVLLVQVPLVRPERHRASLAVESCAMPMGCARRGGGIEDAVIGHGEVEGPFTEIDDLAIERDPRFPVRVTVQLYRATDTGTVDEAAMADIERDISRVYADADFVGSLVVNPNRDRPTAPVLPGDRREPDGWWEQFWARYEKNTGRSRTAALALLWAHRGHGWTPSTKDDLRRALDEL